MFNVIVNYLATSGDVGIVTGRSPGTRKDCLSQTWLRTQYSGYFLLKNAIVKYCIIIIKIIEKF